MTCRKGGLNGALFSAPVLIKSAECYNVYTMFNALSTLKHSALFIKNLAHRPVQQTVNLCQKISTYIQDSKLVLFVPRRKTTVPQRAKNLNT